MQMKKHLIFRLDDTKSKFKNQTVYKWRRASSLRHFLFDSNYPSHEHVKQNLT